MALGRKNPTHSKVAYHFRGRHSMEQCQRLHFLPITRFHLSDQNNLKLMLLSWPLLAVPFPHTQKLEASQHQCASTSSADRNTYASTADYDCVCYDLTYGHTCLSVESLSVHMQRVSLSRGCILILRCITTALLHSQCNSMRQAYRTGLGLGFRSLAFRGLRFRETIASRQHADHTACEDAA